MSPEVSISVRGESISRTGRHQIKTQVREIPFEFIKKPASKNGEFSVRLTLEEMEALTELLVKLVSPSKNEQVNNDLIALLVEADDHLESPVEPFFRPPRNCLFSLNPAEGSILSEGIFIAGGQAGINSVACSFLKLANKTPELLPNKSVIEEAMGRF